VGGTATGTINYTFYCNRSDSGTIITSGYAAKFDGVWDMPKTAVDACNYSTAGTYTAKVIVERGNAPPAEARATITVSAQQTLSVSSFAASPSSGTAPLNGVDLTASVGGTATGTINYTFYCNRPDSGTNITSGWAAKFDSVWETTKTMLDVCNYPTPGTYTAKVIVERGNAPPAEARATITISAQQMLTVLARIDGYSQTNVVQVSVGQSVSLGINFTNTGNTAWRFIAGATVWDASGQQVANYSTTLNAPLYPAQQTTVTWSHRVDRSGDYWIQFAIWKATPYISENLMDKKPVPSQKLIVGK
jgi:hypothetical protein